MFPVRSNSLFFPFNYFLISLSLSLSLSLYIYIICFWWWGGASSHIPTSIYESLNTIYRRSYQRNKHKNLYYPRKKKFSYASYLFSATDQMGTPEWLPQASFLTYTSSSCGKVYSTQSHLLPPRPIFQMPHCLTHGIYKESRWVQLTL